MRLKKNQLNYRGDFLHIMSLMGIRIRTTFELPKNVEDVKRYNDISIYERPEPSWQSEYYKKEGASSRTRHDALFRDAFAIQKSKEDESVDTEKEELQSLLKVPLQI